MSGRRRGEHIGGQARSEAMMKYSDIVRLAMTCQAEGEGEKGVSLGSEAGMKYSDIFRLAMTRQPEAEGEKGVRSPFPLKRRQGADC